MWEGILPQQIVEQADQLLFQAYHAQRFRVQMP